MKKQKQIPSNGSVHEIKISDKYFQISLRSQNYDLETALSELVDNSIDSGASKIKIHIPKKKSEEDKLITITDDGSGMSKEDLLDSMEIGSDRVYQSNDIGYFGSGMKTSILYLGDSVTIKTKLKGDKFYSIIHWDIKNNPRKMVELQEETEDIESSGTKIIIDTGNRFDTFKHTQISQVISRFGIRYHKLIKDPITSINWMKGVEININGTDVISSDPMYRDVKNTEHQVADDIIWEDVNGIDHNISMVAYYLGAHDDGKNEKGEFNTRSQGVYILLNNKYINLGGTFLGDSKVDNYHNFLRIEMNIPKEAIEYFGISMNKNSINDFLDNDSKSDKVIEKIKKVLKNFRSWGQNLYKSKPKKKYNTKEKDVKVLEKRNIRLNNKLQRKGMVKSSHSINKKVPNGTKNRPSGLKYDNTLFELAFCEEGKNGSFWYPSKRENDKIRIEYNTDHSVYKNFIQGLSVKDSDNFDLFMYGMARAQMASYYSDIYPNGYDSGVVTDLWNDVWRNVSVYTNKVLED